MNINSYRNRMVMPIERVENNNPKSFSQKENNKKRKEDKNKQSFEDILKNSLNKTN